ncbi:MAG: aldehyde dehydrogenase family protein [Verrucomicrobia bacterium]|nr:aldehyde dehydrogenase family protein [Verrucomicrobiota bacterium]
MGVISDDKRSGIVEIAQPIGPILAITPVTNPTSTVLFKILIALKTRNPIIISPNRKAAKCSIEAARICYEAALSEDAPEDCVQWTEHSSREQTQGLMRHPKLALILATGGGGLVREAYSSGTPALGVGAGNVPVFIEKSADAAFAVSQILASKTFDNGTICASEQALVVEECLADEVLDQLVKSKAKILTPAEIEAVGRVMFDPVKGSINPDVVGKPAAFIAGLAGIDAPQDTSVLIAELDGVGDKYPLSAEKLSPVLAFYRAPSLDYAIKLCLELNYHGGTGHTASMYSNHDEKITLFASMMNAGRVVVNTPSSQGGVGGMFNTLSTSFTLGCGTAGKNITTDNITARHLLNIQRVARRRMNEKFASFDKSLYLDESIGVEAIEQEYHKNR